MQVQAAQSAAPRVPMGVMPWLAGNQAAPGVGKRASPPKAARIEAADDASMVARCNRGDGSAWSTLVARYQRLVYAIVRRAGLDEHAAADVFQTVFERLIKHLPRIGDPSRLQAWIVTTAKREMLLQLTRSRRNVSMTGADDTEGGALPWEVADDSPIAEDALDDLQQTNRLRNAVDRLDERSRTLLLLLFRDDGEKLPYEEISRIVGIPVGSIGPTRQRALAKLRRLMA